MMRPDDEPARSLPGRDPAQRAHALASVVRQLLVQIKALAPLPGESREQAFVQAVELALDAYDASKPRGAVAMARERSTETEVQP